MKLCHTSKPNYQIIMVHHGLWIVITPTVHHLCAHTWELFQWNNGLPIAIWSECPLESWNKFVRSFQSGTAARARQSKVKNNIHDVLRWMLIASHPEIASKKIRPSICGEMGHTARSSRHKFSMFLLKKKIVLDRCILKDLLLLF